MREGLLDSSHVRRLHGSRRFVRPACPRVETEADSTPRSRLEVMAPRWIGPVHESDLMTLSQPPLLAALGRVDGIATQSSVVDYHICSDRMG